MLAQLLLAKRLYIEAGTYVERGDPVSCGIAISMLQDSAEMYVWTLIKERNITVKDQSGFTANVEALKKAGVIVPNEAKLFELNKARVGFKHYGILPASSEALKYQVYVEDFLKSAMTAHFNVAFDDLSLVDSVVEAETRDLLRNAEKKINQSEFVEAAVELAKAKSVIFGRMGQHLPEVDSRLRDTDRIINEIVGGRGIQSFEYMSDYLGLLREFSLIMMLRLPLEDYVSILNRLPSVSQTLGGAWYVNYNGNSYSEADCRRALSCLVGICQRLETGM